jgi:hypothetical protein
MQITGSLLLLLLPAGESMLVDYLLRLYYIKENTSFSAPHEQHLSSDFSRHILNQIILHAAAQIMANSFRY